MCVCVCVCVCVHARVCDPVPPQTLCSNEGPHSMNLRPFLDLKTPNSLTSPSDHLRSHFLLARASQPALSRVGHKYLPARTHGAHCQLGYTTGTCMYSNVFMWPCSHMTSTCTGIPALSVILKVWPDIVVYCRGLFYVVI